MKKKLLRKTVLVATVAALIGGVLTGCGEKKESVDDTEDVLATEELSESTEDVEADSEIETEADTEVESSESPSEGGSKMEEADSGNSSDSTGAKDNTSGSNNTASTPREPANPSSPAQNTAKPSTPKPTAPACDHKWVPHYATRVIKEAWVEEKLVPETDHTNHYLSVKYPTIDVGDVYYWGKNWPEGSPHGVDYDDWLDANEEYYGGYFWGEIPTGNMITILVGHAPETEEYIDYYTCSVCGAKK